MKKLVCITGLVLFGCLFATAFSAPKTAAQTSVNTVSTRTTQTETAETFIIKAENNHIVVYKKGSSNPYITTDTLVSTLPRSDIRLLENGIEINGQEKLRKAVEDYCS